MGPRIEISVGRAAGNDWGVIKITPEAMEVLAEIVEEIGLSTQQAASIIITQAVEKGLICYKREER